MIQNEITSPTSISSDTKTNVKLSYSTVTTMNKLPTNQQAIIIDKTVDAEFQDYIIALLQVIPGSKILDATILSKKRILIFLDSTQTVDELIDSKKHIIVSHQIVHIRPYLTRTKTITFHHVFPQVENTFLVSELEKCGINILTPITTLSANIQHEQLRHVMSLRRQTTIAFEDVEKLPSRISTLVEGKDIYIFITAEPSKTSDPIAYKQSNPQHKLKPHTQKNTLSSSPVTKESPSPPTSPPNTEKSTDFHTEKRSIEPSSLKHESSPSRSREPSSPTVSPVSPEETSTQNSVSISPSTQEELLKSDWAEVERRIRDNITGWPLSFELFQTLLTDQTNDTFESTQYTKGLSRMLRFLCKYLPSPELKERAIKISDTIQERSNSQFITPFNKS